MSRSVVTGMLARVLLVVALALGVAGCSSATTGEGGSPDGAQTPAITGSSDPGAQLVERKCTTCHTINSVEKASKSREEWVSTVDRMKSNGMVVTDEEYSQIIDFLSGATSQ
ncbi:MAG: hypothetical protein U1E22_08555 [Coriobacteriia bacterium]|nr:hypothetical protein [Coriobacteriia bacterium]